MKIFHRSLSKKLFLVVGVCLVGLQGCGENKVATECYDLQNVFVSQERTFHAGTVTKASELAQAEQEGALAAALMAVELSDDELISRRDELVSLATQQQQISLQSAEIMTESGSLSGNASTRYEEVSAQRRPINDEFYAQQNGLQIHCSLQ